MQQIITNEKFTFTFTDRATYIAWRAIWRAEYAEKTRQIREGRAKYLELARQAHELHATDPSAAQRIFDAASRAQSSLSSNRYTAGTMMRERAAATAYKNAQMAAATQAAA
jgi:hypothetical protein